MSANRCKELGAFENGQNIRFPDQKGSMHPNTYFKKSNNENVSKRKTVKHPQV